MNEVVVTSSPTTISGGGLLVGTTTICRDKLSVSLAIVNFITNLTIIGVGVYLQFLKS